MIHGLIFNAIRREYEKTPNPLGHDVFHDEDEYLIHRYFRNIRGRDENARGLRLSDEGLDMMKAFFASWALPLPEGYVHLPRHIIYLDRITSMPWHLGNGFLTFFEADLAMRAKLAGDIESLMKLFEVQG